MSTVTRGHPMWCRVYARSTPTIPVHNGHEKCIGCGFDVAAYRREVSYTGPNRTETGVSS